MTMCGQELTFALFIRNPDFPALGSAKVMQANRFTVCAYSNVCLVMPQASEKKPDSNREVHIWGAGIAGLCAALGFAKEGVKVTVWEKEMLPCTFASSRNAAIFRSYEADPTLSLLVKNSYLKFQDKQLAEEQILNQCGLLIDPVEIDYYEEGFVNRHADADGLLSQKQRLELPGGTHVKGRLIRGNGIVDVHRLQQYFITQAKRFGAVFRFQEEVKKLGTNNGRIEWFETSQTGRVEPETGDWLLVNAAGSWAPEIAKANGLWSPPVIPHKRHLFFITGPKNEMNPLANLPVLWDEKRDIYLKPEAGGFLSTHCDQRPAASDDFSPDEGQTLRFMESLLDVYPFLGNFTVSRYWACLRTFSFDTLPVVGIDPSIENLFWVAGWGGRGITISMEMVDVIRNVYQGGQEEEKRNPYSPARFVTE